MPQYQLREIPKVTAYQMPDGRYVVISGDKASDPIEKETFEKEYQAVPETVPLQQG